MVLVKDKVEMVEDMLVERLREVEMAYSGAEMALVV